MEVYQLQTVSIFPITKIQTSFKETSYRKLQTEEKKIKRCQIFPLGIALAVLEVEIPTK